MIAYKQAEIRVQKANLQGKYTPEQIKVILQRQAAVIEQQLLAMRNGQAGGASNGAAPQQPAQPANVAQQNTQGGQAENVSEQSNAEQKEMQQPQEGTTTN